MSLILDALNRSREDSSEVPGLDTRHDYNRGEPDRWLMLLAVITVAALATIAWLLWDKPGSEPAVADLPKLGEEVVATPLPTPQPAPTVATTQIVKSAPVAAVTESVAAAEAAGHAGAVPTAAVSTAAASTAENSTPENTATVAPEIEALYQAPPDTSDQPTGVEQADREPASAVRPEPGADRSIRPEPEPDTREPDVDIQQMVRQAEDALEDARLAEHPAPFISELSQQAKDPIPTIYYQRHEYSGRPEQSRVVLNGKSIAKGGSPVADVRVDEILPDSVVLSYQGTQFRLRALNSWVNL